MRLISCFTVAACIALAPAAPSAQKPARVAAAAIHERVAAAVGAIRLVDTHEHLSAEAVRLKGEMSLFSLLHYVSSDMWADGLDRAASEAALGRSSLPLEKQWEMIAPYWTNVRTTAYGRALLRAVRDLYGVNDISESTYLDISKRIREANRPGWQRQILEKAGIDVSITDIGITGAALDPSHLRAVLRLDYFLVVPQGVMVAEREQGVTIATLADFEAALDRAVAAAREKKFVGIKSGVAYERSLEFGEVDRAEAERLFQELKQQKGKPGRADWTRGKALQDYMFGRLAEACAKYDLPLQVHTGFFYDTWRNLAQANPTLLAPFVIRHRNTRFVLMHGGYPYGTELLAMAKNLPNVTLDMCWTYIVSPSFAARFLNEAIETVPADKVLGFGGDYQVAEGSYAHAMLCREVVSKVLAGKVADGYWSEAEALAYARGLLRENAIRVFKLNQ
ncbi:MAG TPA: amidohydrolase family protein [Vicinamibacterales bacterium]|nr:amidohydrolase family protein [Vicinamibacterales bacterium]